MKLSGNGIKPPRVIKQIKKKNVLPTTFSRRNAASEALIEVQSYKPLEPCKEIKFDFAMGTFSGKFMQETTPNY